jgi:hypothetical protein
LPRTRDLLVNNALHSVARASSDKLKFLQQLT